MTNLRCMIRHDKTETPKDDRSETKYSEGKFEDFDKFGLDSAAKNSAIEAKDEHEWDDQRSHSKSDIYEEQAKQPDFEKFLARRVSLKEFQDRSMEAHSLKNLDEVNQPRVPSHTDIFDPYSSMMKKRIESGRKVNKAFEMFVSQRLDKRTASLQNLSREEAHSTKAESALNQSIFHNKAMATKEAIDRTISNEADKIRCHKYITERNQAKEVLQTLVKEFKQMKAEFDVMNQKHYEYKQEYDSMLREIERLRNINSQYVEVQQETLERQQEFMRQREDLLNKMRDIGSEQELAHIELLNLESYIRTNAYLFNAKETTDQFINKTNSVNTTVNYQQEPNDADQLNRSKFTSGEANYPQASRQAESIDPDQITTSILPQMRATLERSRKLREEAHKMETVGA